MLRVLFCIPLIMHGLANIAGILGVWGHGAQAFADRPWVFSNGVTLHSQAGRAFGLLWLVSVLTLIGAGLGILLGQEWWRLLAVVGSVASFLSITPWWKAVVPGARFGAVFDIVVLVVLLSPLGDQIAQLVR